jgi:hypothetical protein
MYASSTQKLRAWLTAGGRRLAVGGSRAHTERVSDETYAIVALIPTLATAVALWSAIRRRQLMKRLLRSLDEQQRRALGLDPPDDPSQTNEQ